MFVNFLIHEIIAHKNLLWKKVFLLFKNLMDVCEKKNFLAWIKNVLIF